MRFFIIFVAVAMCHTVLAAPIHPSEPVVKEQKHDTIKMVAISILGALALNTATNGCLIAWRHWQDKKLANEHFLLKNER